MNNIKIEIINQTFRVLLTLFLCMSIYFAIKGNGILVVLSWIMFISTYVSESVFLNKIERNGDSQLPRPEGRGLSRKTIMKTKKNNINQNNNIEKNQLTNNESGSYFHISILIISFVFALTSVFFIINPISYYTLEIGVFKSYEFDQKMIGLFILTERVFFTLVLLHSMMALIISCHSIISSKNKDKNNAKGFCSKT